MKKKSLFLSLSLICFFAVASFAGPKLKPGDSLEKIVKAELNKYDLDYKALNGETLKIKFMLNEKDEMLIVSTNHKKLDRLVKSALNYEKIADTTLKPFQVYVVPVTFQST